MNKFILIGIILFFILIIIVIITTCKHWCKCDNKYVKCDGKCDEKCCEDCDGKCDGKCCEDCGKITLKDSENFKLYSTELKKYLDIKDGFVTLSDKGISLQITHSDDEGKICLSSTPSLCLNPYAAHTVSFDESKNGYSVVEDISKKGISIKISASGLETYYIGIKNNSVEYVKNPYYWKLSKEWSLCL